MKEIQNYIDQINDEIDGAKNYAELYLMAKAKSDKEWAQRCYEMSQDELKHANWIHEKAVKEIMQLSTVYEPPSEMKNSWDISHKNYIEKAAWIKQMLTM